MQDFGPSTCFCFLTAVAPMLTRENEGSKKSVRKVVQDFVHQQYHTKLISCLSFSPKNLAFLMIFHGFCHLLPCLSESPRPGGSSVIPPRPPRRRSCSAVGVDRSKLTPTAALIDLPWPWPHQPSSGRRSRDRSEWEQTGQSVLALRLKLIGTCTQIIPWESKTIQRMV